MHAAVMHDASLPLLFEVHMIERECLKGVAGL
jgi:hypothetical protein